jgi:hypothetical protein
MYIDHKENAECTCGTFSYNLSVTKCSQVVIQNLFGQLLFISYKGRMFRNISLVGSLEIVAA